MRFDDNMIALRTELDVFFYALSRRRSVGHTRATHDRCNRRRSTENDLGGDFDSSRECMQYMGCLTMGFVVI